MPTVVFIHGLGMSHRVWTSPEEERVFFGNAPLECLIEPEPPEAFSSRFALGRTRTRPVSLYKVLEKEGFNLLAYSQARPSASAGVLVDELHGVLSAYRHWTKKGTIFICHSRGGLILRAYIQKYRPVFPAIGFICLACPHKGSNLARLAGKLNHLLSPLQRFFKDGQSYGTFRAVLSRLFLFLSSEGLRELLPESDFIRSLDEDLFRRLPTCTFSGRRPRLVVLYKWNKNCMSYEEVMRLPDFLTVRLRSLWPEELIDGKGDGLVSVSSARVEKAMANYCYNCNHAEIIYEPRVHRDVLRVLERLC